MRHVFDTSMVAHVWANRSQDDARNSQGNFYFDGDTIYSYGSHFPIARHAEHKGKRCILFSTATYSNTTSKHQGEVRRAISGTVFHVSNLGFRGDLVNLHDINLKDYLDRLSALAIKMPRARSNYGRLKSQFLNLAGEARAYAAFFGLKFKLPLGTVDEMAKECQAERERIESAEKRRQAAMERKARKELIERIERWKLGEVAYISSAPEVYLRVNGDNLETSKGAEIPLAHAVKAFSVIAKCRSEKAGWERNGQEIRVGHFHFDSIEPNGDVKAGCHFIRWGEIERIANQLGLLSTTESMTA